ncbi:MAG: YidC/Oxa1 family membrane protein insertase [Oscillospiraceae bacterium]|nr:YidC/Oxa1 family membrane protein insertase [Oscillospiraceae bacterium]
MFNIPFIQVPFGYLLDWLYQFTANYGIALILFSLILKFILLPMNIKSKKSMLRMSRVAPLAKALEAQYGDDKVKYQQELSKLYKEEGVSTTGGCLWSFIPLFILLPLYYVIREPITYMMHFAAEHSAQIVELIKGEIEFTGNQFYHQLVAAGHITEFAARIREAIPELKDAVLESIDFSFIGINLSSIPTWKFWTLTDWSGWGLFLLPVISGAANILSMQVSQKMNNKVATNDKGEQDKAAAAANQSMGMMMWTMPLVSVWIGFTMPAAITVYWIAQAIFGMIFDAVITVHCRKSYAKEDAERRERAAAAAALEAEKEKIRAERRAANPDGIVENTSKKKRERKEREEAEEARRRYEAEKLGIDPDAPKPVDVENCPSGIAERPYCKGRNYDPDRYNKK